MPRFGPASGRFVIFNIVCLILQASSVVGIAFLCFRHQFGAAIGAGVIFLALGYLTGLVGRNWYNFNCISLVGNEIPTIVSGSVGQYSGIYLPHWEIDHILVPIRPGWLGVFTRYEKWMPVGIAIIPDELSTRAPRGKWLVRFTGIPGGKGRFGFRGFLNREVEVVSVEHVMPMPGRDAFW